MSYIPNVILQPEQFENLNDEVEEQALTMLSNFIDKVWARLDSEEPTIDDYYNF